MQRNINHQIGDMLKSDLKHESTSRHAELIKATMALDSNFFIFPHNNIVFSSF